jgi:hypothetical protein
MSTAGILITGLGVVLLMPLVWRALRRQFDPFEPVVLFALAYGAVFVVRPATMLAGGELSFAGVDLSPTLPLLCVLALAGAVGFLAGYELRPGATLARRLPPPRMISTRVGVAGSLALTTLAGLAVGALVIRFGHGFLAEVRNQDVTKASSSSSYVWYASRLVVPAALCLTALAVRERSKRLGLGAAFAVAASLFLTVPIGSRIFLLPLFGGIIAFAYLHRQRRPSVPVLVGLLVAAFFISYAAVVVREPERRGQAGAEFARLVTKPTQVFSLMLHRGDAEMAPVLAGALTVVPDRLGYRYGGATIGEFFIRPIPRQLWHAKPKPAGEQVVETVWPDLAGFFHPAFSPLLPLYWDFGFAGVFGGMALFGFGCRVIYEWFRRHADRFAAQLIFSAAIWYVVVGVRNEPVDTAVLASFVVLPLILIERLFGENDVKRGMPRPARWRSRLRLRRARVDAVRGRSGA